MQRKLPYILLFLTLSIYFPLHSKSQERPIIRNIYASSTSGNKIKISWDLPKGEEPAIEGLLIYRSLKAFTSYYDLVNLSPIAEIGKRFTQYTDTVTDFNDYFYAVIARTTEGVYDIVLPSINSTINATHLKISYSTKSPASVATPEKEIVGQLRKMPLPYLEDLPSDINNLTYEEGRKKAPALFSIKMHEISLDLAHTTEEASDKVKMLEPYVFEEDLFSAEGGDDYLLFDILKDTFIQSKYKEAATSLTHLIKSVRTSTVINRAKFYLGQAYYYSYSYKEAITTFLQLYGVYPKLAKKYIDSALDLFTIPTE